MIFKHTGKGFVRKLKERIRYHIVTLNIIVHSNIDEVILFVFLLWVFDWWNFS
jgi:hypothetical protein